MLACYHGNLAAVKRYLEAGKGSVNDMDTEGTTLLMKCMSGLREPSCDRKAILEVVQYLIFAGADLNGANNEQWSNLHMAFRHGLLEAARLLIRKGADVDRVTASGETLPMVFLHQEFSRMEYYTMLSAESFNDFDASSSDGYSALHYAALSGTAEDVAMLRRLGGDKMPTTEMNRTPLHSAATYGNASATEELCKYHLETGVDIRDSVGCTLLHRAIRFSSEEQRLKRFIPTDWTRCNNNPRVFHYHETITTLLKFGADPATVVDWCRNHPYGCACPSVKISTYEYAQRFGLETLRVFASALEAAGKELPESYKVQLAETRFVEIGVDEVESEVIGRLTSSEMETASEGPRELDDEAETFEDAVEFQ